MVVGLPRLGHRQTRPVDNGHLDEKSNLE